MQLTGSCIGSVPMFLCNIAVPVQLGTEPMQAEQLTGTEPMQAEAQLTGT